MPSQAVLSKEKERERKKEEEREGKTERVTLTFAWTSVGPVLTPIGGASRFFIINNCCSSSVPGFIRGTATNNYRTYISRYGRVFSLLALLMKFPSTPAVPAIPSLLVVLLPLPPAPRSPFLLLLLVLSFSIHFLFFFLLLFWLLSPVDCNSNVFSARHLGILLSLYPLRYAHPREEMSVDGAGERKLGLSLGTQVRHGVFRRRD